MSNRQQWWLLGTLILGSAIGLFYYLRVMVTLFLVEPGLRRRDAPLHWAQRAGGIMLLAIAAWPSSSASTHSRC